LRSSRNILSRQVADAGECLEAIRLKRRQIVLEARFAQLGDERNTLMKSGKLSAEEDINLETGEKSVACRLRRVEKMLQSRRAIIESDGGADYGKLMDLAANNALPSMESVLASMDLGFTEARLLRVSGRKSDEPTQSSASAYLSQYKNPPAAVLASYRKKYGKRGLIPPPPLTATLLPPPPPYRPGADDLGFFLSPGKLAKNAGGEKGRNGHKQEKRGAEARNKGTAQKPGAMSGRCKPFGSVSKGAQSSKKSRRQGESRIRPLQK
jgi:hypothetical protein